MPSSVFGIMALGLGAVALVIIVTNILKGLIAGFKKSLKSLAVLVLTIIVASIVNAIICNPESGVLLNTGMDLVGDMMGGDLGEIFGVEELAQTFKYYVAMMIGPITFLMCFIVLWVFFSIVAAIVFRCVPVLHGFMKDRPKPVIHRLGGMGVGLVSGYIIAVIMLMPIVGTLNLVTSLPYDTFESDDDARLEEETNVETGDSWYYEEDTAYGYYDEFGNYHEYSDEDNLYIEKEEEDIDLAEAMEEANESLQIFVKAGCGPLYNAYSSAKFEGERVYLKDDIHTLMELVSIISDAESSMDSDVLDHSHTDMLHDVVGCLDESPLLKNTVAGIFSAASESWTKGEEFMGMEKMDAGDLMNPVVDELLAALSDTNYNTIVEDLDTMIEVFETMIDSGILEEMEYAEMLKMMGAEDGVLDQMSKVLNKNKRMTGVADQVSQLSVRALASHLEAGEEYDVLMSDIASTLNANSDLSKKEKREVIKEDLSVAFKNYGVEVEGTALDDVVEGFIDEFDGKDNVSEDEVSAYFAQHIIEESADEDFEFDDEFNY